MPFLRLLLSLFVAATLLAACGDDDDDTTDLDSRDQIEDSKPGSTTTTLGREEVTLEEGDGGVKVTGDTDQKPEVTLPGGSPPANLLYTDLVEGAGTEASPGSSVTAHYVGIGWNTQQEFGASWTRGEPIPFSLNGVIEGWQKGIPGMKVGGRRLLVIPAALAYGDNPPTAEIQPGETLVFVVDLVAVS